MYEKYSRQALPSKRYRKLLGSALCVFNSNNSFIIENILRTNNQMSKLNYTWHTLINLPSGKLEESIKKTITRNSNTNIANLFSNLVSKRNRIIHSFQITHNGKQILATKDDKDNQFIITERYLLEFIKENENLSSLLHNYRGY